MSDGTPRKPRLSPEWRIVAGIGILEMILTGGCSLFFLQGGGMVLLFGGVPFLFGLVTFLVALTYGRR